MRTDEPFFVEEEREKRLDSLFEADVEVGSQAAVLHLDTVEEWTGCPRARAPVSVQCCASL